MLSKARYHKLFKEFLTYTDEKGHLAKGILRIIKPRKIWTFLDVGCGTGEITVPIARRVSSTVAIDINGYVLDQAKKNARGLKSIKFVKADWTKVKSLGKFDFVLSSHALYSSFFRGQLRAALIKLVRHVKPGGYLLIIHFGTTGDVNKMIKKFSKKLQGTKITKQRVEQDDLYIKNMLKKMGYSPHIQKVSTYIVTPSIEQSLFLTEWILGVPYNKFTLEQQRDLLTFLKRRIKNGKVVISGHHSFIWAKIK